MFYDPRNGNDVWPCTMPWHGFRHQGHDWSRLNFRGADGYSNDHYCWVGVNNELERATAIVFRRRKG